jgi:hypothetical protein
MMDIFMIFLRPLCSSLFAAFCVLIKYRLNLISREIFADRARSSSDLSHLLGIAVVCERAAISSAVHNSREHHWNEDLLSYKNSRALASRIFASRIFQVKASSEREK